MVYIPLSDAPDRHLGPAANARATGADDEVYDLPGGVFFTSGRTDDPPGSRPGLYYKDGTDIVRRVRHARAGTFLFAPLSAAAHFTSAVEVLFVPEVDPRSWTAAQDGARKPLPELAALRRGSFFTALAATESHSSSRFGVYRLSSDGMFRRLLKEHARGLKWSDAIPSDRFGHFGQCLAINEE